MFNDMPDGKKNFVTAVADLLRDEPRSGVTTIIYISNFRNASMEVVGIVYVNGHVTRINVTGNSNGAILKEIVAEVYGEGAFGRFEE